MDGRALNRLGDRLIATLAVVLAALGIVQLSALIALLAYRHVAWTGEARGVAARVEVLTREVADLTERAARAGADGAYLETLARRQGFVAGTERVILPLPPERAASRQP